MTSSGRNPTSAAGNSNFRSQAPRAGHTNRTEAHQNENDYSTSNDPNDSNDSCALN